MRGNAPLVTAAADPTLTSMVDNTDPPERPRAEPEIIPPDRTGRRSGQPTWPPAWGSSASGGAYGSQRIYVMRPGPLGFAVMALVLAVILSLVFLVVIGAFLLWIPVVALLVVVGAVYRFLRR